MKSIKYIIDKMFHYLGFLLMMVIVACLLFWINNYRYFIYALIVAVIIFLLRNSTKTGWKAKGEYFLMLLALIYFPLLTLMSVSPFLKFKEFQWTHPGWQQTKGQVLSYTSEWENPFRRSSGYAFIDVSYQYTLNHKTYTNTEQKAEKMYYPIWESKERIQLLKAKLLQQTKQQIDSQKCILLYNATHPKESRFFVSRSLFYLQGSAIYAFSIFIGVLIVLLIINLFFSFKNKNTI
ncbi:hypothetical protein [Chryseobacterium sp. SIMBA_028]|uniref:hypothetical protein n=1 Tax=Chryseobacterium sp. SIMBA_028 TaxID=3085771 RepID=UPI00397A691D